VTAGRGAIFLAAASLALGLAVPAQAACPRLILVSGKPLAEPIVISDWGVACTLYGALFGSAPAEPMRPAERPAIRLGLFWGPVWEPYVRDGRLGELTPGRANQVGRFYPAVGREPALVDFRGYGYRPRAVGEAGLRILALHGVAIRIDGREASDVPWSRIGLIGGAVFALSLLLLALGLRRDRRFPPLV
jgi:hypothetical protein